MSASAEIVGPIRRVHYGGAWTPRRLLGRRLIRTQESDPTLGYFVGARPSENGGVDARIVLNTEGQRWEKEGKL